jgi:pyruvate ferredoxin oxidoreductase gamma subunit
VQDSTLIKDVNVFAGMKKGGIILINTSGEIDGTIPEGVRYIPIDATRLALDVLGVPITNTTLMGAFAAASGEITLEALEEAVRERFSGSLADKNVTASRKAFELVKGGA